MAFPLETGRLLAQLRTAYIAFDDGEQFGHRIIKPIVGLDEEFQVRGLGGDDGCDGGLSLLPRITFDVAGHVRKGLSTNLGGNGHSRRKSGNIKKRRRKLAKSQDSKDFENFAVLEQPHHDTAVKTKKSILPTPSIVKFFKKQDESDSDSGRSINIIQQTNLDLIQEEDVTDDGDITEKEAVPVDRLSLDSDFGVPVDKTGKVVPRVVSNITDDEDGEDDEDDEEDEEDGDAEDEDEDDYNFAEDEEEEEFEDSELEFSGDSSTDSAFTDIESNPTLDSSMLLNSYESPSNAFLDPPPTFMDPCKKTRKKRHSNSFEYSRILVSNNLKQISLSQASEYSIASKLLPSAKSYTSLKKTAIVFDKITPKNDVKSSNLSSMINSKFQSIHKNPLNYYVFANSDITDPKIKKVNITVFSQGKLVLKDIEINNNIVVSDCIGYILLCLTKEVGFNELSINPNHWRLELADEDGEEYGEFGVLNRTRLFSSYNNPKYLVLSMAKDGEIAENDKQTPLSMEFKMNLAQFVNRRSSAISSSGHEDKVELRIQVQPTKPAVRFLISNSATVGHVIMEFCRQEGLDSSKYVLKGTTDPLKEQKVRSLLFPNNSNVTIIPESSQISDLSSNLLYLAPLNSKTGNITEDLKRSQELDTQITPSDSTLTTKNKYEAPVAEPKPQKHASVTRTSSKSTNVLDKLKRQVDHNRLLEDIINGESGDLPTNLNSIYFKWRVWRKKPAIMAKLERSFTIDGDYIWLTPPDDIYTKTIGTDNPFDGHFSHHHRHHFNNLYKLEQLLKTISFHITQVVKVKQYKNSKNPKLFRIVINKQPNSTTAQAKDEVKKKYYLEAETVEQCEDIVEKLSWTSQVYKLSIINQ
jgi:hypothetical protein